MGAKRRRGQREKDGGGVACVQTSPISFVAKEIGDVCTQARGGGERRKGIIFSFSLDQLSRGSIPYFIQHNNNTLRIDKTRQYFLGVLYQLIHQPFSK